MLLHECVYSVCKACDQRVKRLSDETYGCDTCRAVIDLNHKGSEYLEATVFHHNDTATKRLQFCSWRCCVKKLKTVKTDYFISLPYLHYDKGSISAKEFFKLVKP
jgi:hypothetical protein